MRRRHLLTLFSGSLFVPVVGAQETRTTSRFEFSVKGLSGDPVRISRFRQGEMKSERVFLAKDRGGREWLAYEPGFLDVDHVEQAFLVPIHPGQQSPSGQALRLKLTTAGQKALAEASRKFQGESLGVFFNARLEVVATIRSELTSHSLELSLDHLSLAELETLVAGFAGRKSNRSFEPTAAGKPPPAAQLQR